MTQLLKAYGISLLLVATFSAASFAQGQLPADRDTMLTGAQWETFNKSVNAGIFSDSL